MESTGEKCPNCLRLKAQSWGEWLDSDPDNTSDYRQCGADVAIDDNAKIDCLQTTVGLLRQSLANAESELRMLKANTADDAMELPA